MRKTFGKGMEFIQSIMFDSFTRVWMHCNNIVRHQKYGNKLPNGTGRRAYTYLGVVCSPCPPSLHLVSIQRDQPWGSPDVSVQGLSSAPFFSCLQFPSPFDPEAGVICTLLVIEQGRNSVLPISSSVWADGQLPPAPAHWASLSPLLIWEIGSHLPLPWALTNLVLPESPTNLLCFCESWDCIMCFKHSENFE